LRFRLPNKLERHKELLAMFAFLDVLVPRGKKYGEREHHLKIGRFTIDAKNVVDLIGLKMYLT
jgi:hypothetical protein